jgi:putative ABC transport system ATP-binding protein
MKSGEPILRVEGLTKVFGSGRTQVRAVDGVDLHACAGEIMLIMGPSGSGKTTLTMIGALRPRAATSTSRTSTSRR